MLPVLSLVFLQALGNVTLYPTGFVVVIYPPSFRTVYLYHVYSLSQSVHCPHFELYFRNGIGSVDPFSGGSFWLTASYLLTYSMEQSPS